MRDKNDQPLKPGDRVTVECVVSQILPHKTEHANVELLTVEPMPGADSVIGIWLNTAQVVLIPTEPVEESPK